jgi:hypothetical protein
MEPSSSMDWLMTSDKKLWGPRNKSVPTVGGQPFGGGFGFQPPQYGGGFGQPFGGGFQQPQYGGGFGFQPPQFGGFQNQGPGNAYARQNPYQPPAPPQFSQQPPPGMELNPDYRPRGPGMQTMDMRPSDEMFRPIQRANPATGVMPSEPISDPNYAPTGGGLPARPNDQFFGPVMTPTVEPEIRPAVMPSYGSPYGGFGGPYGGSPYGGMFSGLGGFFGGRGMFPFNQGFAVPSQNGPAEATRFNPSNPADVQAQADAQKRQLQSEQMSDYQRLMARKNAASFAPSTGGLGLGGLQPINMAPSDIEIARSLGFKDPQDGMFMTMDVNPERDARRAKEAEQRAKDYLGSIGYGQAGFDPSKYEVRRQPTNSDGLSSLFSGLGGGFFGGMGGARTQGGTVQPQFSPVAQNQQPNLRNLQEAALQHEADVRRDWLTNQAPSYVPPPRRTAEEEQQIVKDYLAKNPWAAGPRQS